MPEITNPNTKLQLQKFGEYKYSSEVAEYKLLPYLGPYELENNAVYYGQWKDGLKHGKGKQVQNFVLIFFYKKKNLFYKN